MLAYGWWSEQECLIIERIRADSDIKFIASIGVDEGFPSKEDIISGKNITVPDKEALASMTLFEECYSHFLMFYLMFERKGQCWKPVGDMKLIFFKMLFFADQLLQANKPDVLLFNNIPHEGFDYVLYLVAKKRGLKTLLVYQSIFPQKFFLCDSIDSVGDFLPKRDVNVTKVIESAPAYPTVMPNMDVDLTLNMGHKILNFFKYAVGNYDLFLTKLRARNWEGRYKMNLARSFSVSDLQLLELDKNRVIYVPLHLQPEMTSVSLAGHFEEQLFAISYLRSCLPDDWIVLVKENPKQTHFQRGDEFFQILQALPNTYLVKKNISSQKILASSCAVATLTGSAGWEAISVSKKAIVFGNAWYKNFKNVLRYPFSSEDLSAFLNAPVDSGVLDDQLRELFSRAYDGVVDPDYNSVVEGFDVEENCELTASNLVSATLVHGKSDFSVKESI